MVLNNSIIFVGQNKNDESKRVTSPPFSHLQSGEVRLTCTNPRDTSIPARLIPVRRVFLVACSTFIFTFCCFQGEDLGSFCGNTSCEVRVNKEKLFERLCREFFSFSEQAADGSQNERQSSLKANDERKCGSGDINTRIPTFFLSQSRVLPWSSIPVQVLPLGSGRRTAVSG